ncbi:pyridine nucleotide-disulfide oxidoreductase [Actinorhabdospora filicis]|uniref:Pyridine nucleotide-disulfide oxidoreductase n=1 Tax=Actinorhabdospora filicis TaxID=1785913 RepID=A0A9W6SMK3_9ACTN|nr:NAD(P)/FAD-dependent oxidoreductase [Actinorhabdospora filicis]GLZ78672.1 pyridine nucleotide-disulfide oxidoreductase [Actinorhabdospora filicis]
MTEVDAIILGMGVGGEEIAERLADAGLRVLGVDGGLVGGECPYWGCIPSKMMIRAANLIADARRLEGIGGFVQVTPDWAPVASRIRSEATDDWDDKVAVERFTGKGGTFVRGRGKLAGPGRVEVDGVTYTATRAVVVATGGAPVIPPIEGLAGTPYWTNREAIATETAPSSLIVLGGGAIGVELGQVFARFGTAVTIVEGAGRLLPAEEPEASEIVHQALAEDDIRIRVGARAVKVAHDGQNFTLTLDDGTTETAEKLLVAVGRKAQMADLGLETVGIDPSGHAIPVDGHMRAGDKLWAVGDVTGHGQFTHVAMYQAAVTVRDILGEPGPPTDYRALPRVTFTDPEVGAVGMTEQQARDAGLSVHVGITQIPTSARGWIYGDGNEGIVKLVIDTDRDLLVGATVAAPSGGETMGALAVAVYAEVKVTSMRNMMYAYPTFYRAIEDALRHIT